MCTTRFNLKIFYFLITLRISLLWIDLRRSSDYFPTQH